MADDLNYPLRFEPIFKERIWGGRRLETVLGKKLPSDRPIGESWEISEHGDDCTLVANGPQRGKTLRDLTGEFPQAFPLPSSRAGATAPDRSAGFPLLVKWIDAHKDLSVQVHPPDGDPRLAPGESGKTECWMVIDAETDSQIYLGLRRGFDRASLVRELERGTLKQCLNIFPARAGDFYFVPAGMVHAIGAGVLVAEISQSSDTTLRLFDWNRVDPATGRPRKLQVEASLDCIDWQCVPCRPVHTPLVPAPRSAPAYRASESAPAAVDQASRQAMLLGPDQCPHFTVAARHIVVPTTLGGHGPFHVLICIGGMGEITGGGQTLPIRSGDTVLLPATGKFVCTSQPVLQLLDASSTDYLHARQ
jgi:mannose-6-phosphate isomerase